MITSPKREKLVVPGYMVGGLVVELWRGAGRSLFAACMVAAWLLAAPPSRASNIDNMDNTNGFFSFTVVQFVGPGPGDVAVNPPGYLLPTATANGDGTVTLAVQDNHSDTSDQIIDWTMPGSVSNPYIDLTANRFLQLDLTSVLEGRNYDVFLLYWGSGTTPAFLSETEWLNLPGSNDLHPTLDVTTLAPISAAQYFLRFRLFPTNISGGTLTLDSIRTSDVPSSSIPEPATGGLLGLAILAVYFYQSRRASPRTEQSGRMR